jgi:hypothetical protein
MKRAMRAGVLAALAGLSGCIVKEVYVGDDAIACRDDFDCRESGMPPGVCEQGVCVPEPADPTLACLGKGPPETTNEIVPFEMLVTTLAGVPVTSATVRVCSRLEAARCNTPLGAPTRVDAAGLAHLEVPQNFNGYFEVYGPQGPDIDDPDFVRSLVFAPPREIVRGGKGRGVFVFTRETVGSLAQLVGASFDSNSGLAIMLALDCTGRLAPNISFDLTSDVSRTPNTKLFYTYMTLPTSDATATDLSGTGGLTNLNEGPLTISATINPLEKPLVDRADAFVRKGWITHLYVSP